AVLLAIAAKPEDDLDHHPLVPGGRRGGHDELPVDELAPQVVLGEGLEVLVGETGLGLDRHRSPPASTPRRIGRDYDMARRAAAIRPLRTAPSGRRSLSGDAPPGRRTFSSRRTDPPQARRCTGARK